MLQNQYKRNAGNYPGSGVPKGSQVKQGAQTGASPRRKPVAQPKRPQPGGFTSGAFRGPGGTWYFLNKMGKAAEMKNAPAAHVRRISNPWAVGVRGLGDAPWMKASAPGAPSGPVTGGGGSPSAPSANPAFAYQNQGGFKNAVRELEDAFNVASTPINAQIDSLYKDGQYTQFDKYKQMLDAQFRKQAFAANAGMASSGMLRSGARNKVAQDMSRDLLEQTDSLDKAYGRKAVDELKMQLGLLEGSRSKDLQNANQYWAEVWKQKEQEPDPADLAPSPSSGGSSKMTKKQAQNWHDKLVKAFQAAKKSGNREKAVEIYKKINALRKHHGVKK